MDYHSILNYFENSARSGDWHSLYNPKNPKSYSFIVRLHKTLTMARPFKNKKVIDLGCGTGVLMPFVLNEGGQYTGLDAAGEMLDEIKRVYPAYINREDVSFIFGDLNKLDLPEGFEIMMGLGFIEYFDNPTELVKKLYDKMPEGGRLILSFPNSHSLDYFIVQLLKPFRRLANMLFKKSTHQPPRRLWHIKDAKSLYSKAGFKNLKVSNYNVNIFAYPVTKISMPFVNFWAKKLEYSVLARCSFFATGFLVLGEK